MGSFPNILQLWLVDLYPLMVVYRKTLNLFRKFKFIGNFKVTQYFVAIVGLNFQFHIKIHCMARKQCVFLAQKAGKRSLFSEALAGISALTQWTPCDR